MADMKYTDLPHTLLEERR